MYHIGFDRATINRIRVIVEELDSSCETENMEKKRAMPAHRPFQRSISNRVALTHCFGKAYFRSLFRQSLFRYDLKTFKIEKRKQ